MRTVCTKSLATTVCSPSGIDWSEDDQLAVVTQKGVLVYDIIANASNVADSDICFKQELVPAMAEVNPYLEDVNIDRDRLLDELSPADQFKITTLTHRYPSTEHGKPVSRVYEYASWTPKGAVLHGDCALVTLTEDHWLRVMVRDWTVNSEWETLVDVSEKFHSHLKSKKWRDCVSPDVTGPRKPLFKAVGDLKARMYMQGITYYVWSNVLADGELNRSLLVTALRNGKLAVWECVAEREKEPRLELSSFVQTGFEERDEITYLNWYKVCEEDFLLFVGSCDGRVQTFSVRWAAVEDDEPIFSDLGFALWEFPDRSRVSLVTVLRDRYLESSVLRLAVAKDSYLIVADLEVDLEKKTIAVPRKSPMPVGSSRIVDIQPLIDGTRLVVTEKGPPKRLIVNDDITCKLEPYESRDETPMDTKNYKCCGARRSNGGSLFVFLQNVSAYHDHLILRTPGKLIFQTPYTFENLIEGLVGDKELAREVEFHRDTQELFRVSALKEDSDSGFEAKLDRVVTHIDTIKDLKLKVWIAQFCAQVVENSEQKRFLLQTADVTSVSVLILHALNLIRNGGHPQLNPSLAHFIREHTEDEDILREISKVDPFDWRCLLCAGAFGDARYDSVECENGHTWPRCVLSLQPCQSPVLYTCEKCDSIAVPDLDLPYVCTLCDNRLLQMT